MCLQIVFKIVKRQHFFTQLYNYMTLRSECRGRTLRDRPEIHLPKVNPLFASLLLNSEEERIGTSLTQYITD